eukprot:scaffold4798_cov375-Prasinococcus_capsulatus_cf.AAC.3
MSRRPLSFASLPSPRSLAWAGFRTSLARAVSGTGGFGRKCIAGTDSTNTSHTTCAIGIASPASIAAQGARNHCNRTISSRGPSLATSTLAIIVEAKTSSGVADRSAQNVCSKPSSSSKL